MIKNETYKIIKSFVNGFARNTPSVSKKMKKSIRQEAFEVIETYFPTNTSERKQANLGMNQDLKEFYDEMVGKEQPEKVDPQMCLKGYLVRHGDEMSFPKERCEHCNHYGAYDVPEENHEVRFCSKYEAIGKRIKDLESLARTKK